MRREIDDVERVTRGFVEASVPGFIEVADGLVVQIFERDHDDVVAADDARLGQTVLDAEFHLGTNSTDGACDGRRYAERS